MPWTKETRAEQLDAIDGGSDVRIFALFVGSPVASGVEVAGSGYSRVTVTMSPADVSTSPVDKVNANDAAWVATAADWPDAVDFLAVYGSDNATLKGYIRLNVERDYDMSFAGASLTLPAGAYIERQP
jgi:hypothetical protein